MFRTCILLITLITTSFCFGQDVTETEHAEIEASLSLNLQKLRQAKTDDQINDLNKVFKDELNAVITEDWAFEYPFTKLNSIGKVFSEDREVRIISWNIQLENGEHKYHAYVLKRKGRKDGHYVTELIDNSNNLPPETQETLTADNWYGALYYDIKDIQKGRKTYYTLFGYDAKNKRSTLKMLDVLYFTGKTPRLGNPLFETKEGYAKRVYFEHSAKCVMSLKYDDKRDLIIFDHLSPEAPNLAEFREYYVPDMSYDAYKFENNKWRLKEDIIAINKEQESETISLRGYDAESDTVISIDVKDKWEDPSNPNAPIDSGSHKAVLPDDAKESKNKKTAKKKTKQKESEFSGVSFSKLPKKKKRRRSKRD